MIVVHVAGAVRRPGLVRLAERSRVQDAITAAGGLTRAARPGELNLAQLLTDGQQVLIGTAQHPVTEVREGGGPPQGTGASTLASPIDLNHATATQLEQLPGVGPVTAANIIGWRQQRGRFASVAELQQVDGIGPRTYARIAPHVRV
jgi:competence protein ComEA